MEKIFLSVLNMSLTASFVIVAILFARLPLKKAPKIISYTLWVVAGFRLIFPFTLESMFSLLPFKAEPIPQDIAMQAAPRIDCGITIIDNAISASLPTAVPYASANPLQIWIFIGSCVWLFGVAVMLIYSFMSIVLLKRRLRGAALIEDNLYETDNLKTPFVIGLFRPRIYIPAGLTGEECRYIILHEQTHIRRYDHAIKIFAYFVLCLHWFNPLAWVAFILMGADMEMSCDERVMREFGGEIKTAYSLSLVRVAAGRKILNGSPLAFGEGGMKERVKNVLRYKKPHLFISIAAIILIFVAAMALVTNRPTVPAQKSFADMLLSYRTEYVGDNTKVGGLVTAIEYPNKVVYDSFELFTNERPFALTINFNTDTDTRNFYTGALNETPFKKNAILIFALIHNAEYVTFNLDDGVNPYSIQFTRGEADSFAEGDIWNYSTSIEKMEELLVKVNALSLSTIPEKTPLLYVNLVTISVNGNSQTQISRDVGAAQLTNDWYIVDENGDGFGYSADSFHPLQKRDGYGDITLNLNNSGVITLLFSDDYPPQSVSVQRWNAEYAGTDSTDVWDTGEPINVTGNTFQISDDGNDYIYEVYAKWQEGDSWYVFRIDSTNHTSAQSPNAYPPQTIDDAVTWYLDSIESDKYLKGYHFVSTYRILDTQESSDSVTIYAHILCEWLSSEGKSVSGGAGLVSMAFAKENGEYSYKESINYIKPTDYDLPQKVLDVFDYSGALYFSDMREEMDKAVADWTREYAHQLPETRETTTPDENPFSSREVAAAKAVVEKYFKAWADKDEDAWWATWSGGKPENAATFGDWTITPNDIRYNPKDSTRESYVKNGRGSINNTSIENVIVFKCDFNVHYPDGIATSAFNEGDYTDWSVILIRQNAEAEWFIDDNGY